jgi:hypothetical protein
LNPSFPFAKPKGAARSRSLRTPLLCAAMFFGFCCSALILCAVGSGPEPCGQELDQPPVPAQRRPRPGISVSLGRFSRHYESRLFCFLFCFPLVVEGVGTGFPLKSGVLPFHFLPSYRRDNTRFLFLSSISRSVLAAWLLKFSVYPRLCLPTACWVGLSASVLSLGSQGH